MSQLLSSATWMAHHPDDDLTDPPMSRSDLAWLIAGIVVSWFAVLAIVMALINGQP